MASGSDLLNAAQRFRGERYSTAGGRTSPTSGFKDCSGLITAAYFVATGKWPGGTVSTTIETWAVHNGGHHISRAEALRTPGACAAIWGLGAGGHIGFTTGDGRIFETPSIGRVVGFSPFDRNRWTRFFTLPGIDYGAGPSPQAEPAPPPPVVLQSGDLGMDGIFHEGMWHFFTVRDDGALIERYGGGDNPNQASVIMPAGWCRPGDGARVKVLDPAPNSDVHGYAVAALRTTGDVCNVAVYQGKGKWVLRGWPS